MTTDQQIELGPVEAFQDLTHKDKNLFRVVLRGVNSIQEIALRADGKEYELSSQKQFVNSINRLSHILWFQGVPQNGMKLTVKFQSETGTTETLNLKVRSDALQTYFGRLVSYSKSGLEHLVHGKLRGVYHDLVDFRDGLLIFIARFKHKRLISKGTCQPFKDVWLFMDRPNVADDNAEHLYRYVMRNHPDQNICFVLNRKSKDWSRLASQGFNLVDIGTKEWMAAFLEAKVVFSSHMTLASSNPLPFYFNRYLQRKFVFLRHGVGISNRHAWLNRRKIDLMIISSKWEYDALVNTDRFVFTDIDLLQSGLARFDELKELADTNEGLQNTLLVMPTWRKEFVNFTSVKRGNRSIDTNAFKNSKFYQNWNGFFADPKLAELARDHSLKIRLVLHPNLQALLELMEIPDFVELHHETGDTFQQALVKSRALVTDYTSVSFDMAFISRPTFYMQFDRAEFFGSASNSQIDFDYQNQGFGPVSSEYQELLADLSGFLGSGLADQHKQRIEQFFGSRDTNARHAIISEAIKRLT
jgi:hypothetical protein